jgi:hypothetical protein
MLFKDISNYNNINDYLPILSGCINSDLVIIFLVYHNIVRSNFLKIWYKKYQISSVIAHVLICFIVIIIARFLYKFIFKTFSIIKFTGLCICLQVIHDILFYLFFTIVPRDINAMLDFFKDYSKEFRISFILIDILMIVMACLFSSYFATFNLNNSIITLITSVYFVPCMINYI